MIDSPDIPLSRPTQNPSRVKHYISRGLSEENARGAVANDLTLLRTRRDIQNQKRKLSEAEKLSLIDPLTGLFSRGHFDGNNVDNVSSGGELKRQFDAAIRSENDLSLLMIDIDDFKKYNDSYGHPAGDIALKEIADMIRKTIRTTDLAFRYGGEELVILLPETDPASAQNVAEKLRIVVENIVSLKRSVTISVGVAVLHNPKATEGELNQSVDSRGRLVSLADTALYYSKQNGKNQVTLGNNLTDEQILVIHRPVGK